MGSISYIVEEKERNKSEDRKRCRSNKDFQDLIGAIGRKNMECEVWSWMRRETESTFNDKRKSFVCPLLWVHI